MKAFEEVSFDLREGVEKAEILEGAEMVPRATFVVLVRLAPPDVDYDFLCVSEASDPVGREAFPRLEQARKRGA